MHQADLQPAAPLPPAKGRGRGYGRRWQPGQSGNPIGFSKAARERVEACTRQLALMEMRSAAAPITRKCIEMALNGNPVALKLAMDRIMPPKVFVDVQQTVTVQGTALQALSDEELATLRALTAKVAPVIDAECEPVEANA